MKFEIVKFTDEKKYNSIFYRVNFSNHIDDSASNKISEKITQLFLPDKIILMEMWGLDFTKGILHIDDSILFPSEIVNKFIEFYENIGLEITLIQISDTGNL